MGRPKGSTNRSKPSATNKPSTAGARQTALSFKSKITKAGSSPLTGKAKQEAEHAHAKAIKLEEELSSREVTDDVSAPTSADTSIVEPEAEVKEEGEQKVEGAIWGSGELAIRQPLKEGAETRTKDEADEKARKIGEAQIKRYWKGVDDMRTAPRVHQKGLSLHEKILRHFDMSSQFGPCIGIPRTKRWKRANRLGLSPPIEVLAVLLKEDEGMERTRVQRALVDELVNARLGIVSAD